MIFRFLRKIEDNIADARTIGASFVVRHLKPFATRHSFTFGGKPVTIRAHSTDSQIVRYLLRDGEYDLEDEPRRRVLARYKAILAAGETPVIIDAGGNIGLTALWFAKTYPEAKIVTIEPDPGNYQVLSENVSHWPNIIPTRSALGGKPGSANLSGEAEWAYQTQRADGGDTPIITIAQAVQLAGQGASLLIVKIDIEGFEEEVFEGDCSWLDETACLMIEPHDWLRPAEATSRSFQREVGTRDFSLHIRGNNLLYVRRD